MEASNKRPPRAVLDSAKHYVVSGHDFSVSEVDDDRDCLTSFIMGQIKPLKKQLYDTLSLLTLLSGTWVLLKVY